MIRYHINLTKTEVEELMQVINKGSHSTQTFRAAYVLLNSDEGEYSQFSNNEDLSDISSFEEWVGKNEKSIKEYSKNNKHHIKSRRCESTHLTSRMVYNRNHHMKKDNFKEWFQRKD